MKKALVIGHTGQDGSYLTEYLESLNYHLIGVSSSQVYNPQKVNVPEKFELVDPENVKQFVAQFQPDEIYYLAAYHQSSTDLTTNDGWLFNKSFEINTHAFVNLLQILVDQKLSTKVFYAASSHVFGLPQEYPQTENTPFEPKNIYGISKVAAIHAARYYQNTFGIQTSIGILYNHESPRRGDKFVTQKIIKTAVAIKNKEANILELGDLSASIDWGYAPDYVRAFHAMLQQEVGDTYIVATNKLHTVADFVKTTFDYLEIDPSKHVKETGGIITKKLNGKLCGDNSKLKNVTGWEPTTTFAEMIQIMIESAWRKH